MPRRPGSSWSFSTLFRVGVIGAVSYPVLEPVLEPGFSTLFRVGVIGATALASSEARGQRFQYPLSGRCDWSLFHQRGDMLRAGEFQYPLSGRCDWSPWRKS